MPTTQILSGDTKTVLLVEDEESHALLIRRAFEKRGQHYAMDVVRTLREARRINRAWDSSSSTSRTVLVSPLRI